MIPDNHVLLAKLCAFYPGSAADADQLHDRVSVPGVGWPGVAGRLRASLPAFLRSTVTVSVFSFKCGLPSLEECRTLAEAAVWEGDLFSAVKFHLLSSEPADALRMGIDHVKGTARMFLLISFL